MASIASSKSGQLLGPFTGGDNLIAQIEPNFNSLYNYIGHLGVEVIPNIGNEAIIVCNGIEYKIGDTGLLDIVNCKITSMYFKYDMSRETKINYVLYYNL